MIETFLIIPELINLAYYEYLVNIALCNVHTIH